MNYFDAHTHTSFPAYDTDRDAVMTRAREAGVGMNLVGTRLETSHAAVEVAAKYPETWATIGLHPTHTAASHHDANELSDDQKALTEQGEVFDAAAYESLAASDKVIAIGECGLDYFRLAGDTKKLQQDIFIQQIELANKLHKPLMLHVRPSKGTMDAYEDALAILKVHARVPGDSHFFVGSWDIARRFLDLGFMLSFTGVVTFTHDYDEVVRGAPLDMILSETDAPYVTPVPHRGERNEPAYIPQIVEAIAGIRGHDVETVRAQILANAQRLFNIA